MTRRWILPLAVGLVALVGGGLRAQDAEPAPALLAADAAADAAPLTADQRARLERYRGQPGAVGARAVRLSAEALAGAGRLLLNLPDRRAVRLDRAQAGEGAAAAGAVAWSEPAGAEPDPTAADVTLVGGQGEVVGTIRADGRLYALRPLGTGRQALIEIDAAALPPHHPPGVIQAWPEPPAASPTRGDAAPAADAAGRYRVLVAYTPAARRAAGNINGLIDLAVAETNRSYLGSGVRTQGVLAGIMPTGAAEGMPIDVATRRLYQRGDGMFDNVHPRRDRARADIVILISAHWAFCGYAGGINAPASRAFAVVSVYCATGYYSFGHEIGHIQGARHNPEADPSTRPFAHGHGYCDRAAGWRTIMSYRLAGGGCEERVILWSNPRARRLGRPVGTFARHDNVRVLNQTSRRVANFRRGTP